MSALELAHARRSAVLIEIDTIKQAMARLKTVGGFIGALAAVDQAKAEFMTENREDAAAAGWFG